MNLAKENIFVVEIKHITKMVFDEDGFTLSLQEELSLF